MTCSERLLLIGRRFLFFRLSLVSFFFFKQKTAYEMRISDWSSDVCSSDLMWRERHDRRLSRFEGLPARQAFDLGRALPGLPRETAQSQREDIGAGSDLQGAQAFLPRSPPRAHRGRVRRSHGSAWMGRAV